jgi:hypothetical protein
MSHPDYHAYTLSNKAQKEKTPPVDDRTGLHYLGVSLAVGAGRVAPHAGFDSPRDLNSPAYLAASNFGGRVHLVEPTVRTSHAHSLSLLGRSLFDFFVFPQSLLLLNLGPR